ncbi:MAG TPA: HNH endonuclease [Gemmatimonadales bacterium]|nr:HNH endonuclease [Gemmatimonadales bacterium]
MSLDLDLELRLAVFDHVQRLAAASGGLVTGRMLNEGLTFHGERVPIWNQQKGIFRPAVLREPGAALSIQTAFDGPYDDRYDVGDDQLLYRYRGTDPQHPDNRAVRRAMELGRPLLYLVAVDPGVYDPVFPCYVVGDAPAQLAFHLMADAQARQPADVDPRLNIPLKAYATRVVKQRLHQERFRYLVLGAYRRRCAMCRLRHTPLLDAAHILPDRDERGAPEIPNGLALCRIHHGAYDVGILGVDPTYRIHLRQDVLDEHDGPMLKHGLQELHGGEIDAPRRPEHRPNPGYLAERFARFEAA